MHVWCQTFHDAMQKKKNFKEKIFFFCFAFKIIDDKRGNKTILVIIDLKKKKFCSVLNEI